MKPFTVNGDVWRVVSVEAGSPSLIDRTGKQRLATTDPESRVVHIVKGLKPPLLDRVLLHEVAHAVTISYDMLEALHTFTPKHLWVQVEEWAVQLVETHGIEAAEAASESLGRPICIGGFCHD